MDGHILRGPALAPLPFLFLFIYAATGLHLTITSGPLALFGALFLVLFFNTQSDDLRFYLTLTVAILILLYWADLHYTHVDSILDHSSSVRIKDSSNARKVRRIYQKTVEKKINEGLSITPDKTPGEIRQMVDTPVLNQLTALYERARYTEEPISSQELREVGRHHSE